MTSRYQVVRSIAKGGMAEVFLARMTGEAGFEKTVALKRLPPAFAANDDVVKMLMDEARLAARLNHPQVVQVFDFGKDDDGYYIAMEYVNGPDLNTVLKYFRAKAARPPESPMISVMIQALRGLDYAHRLCDEAGTPLGVVHRDVSPSNVLVTVEGVAKVSDFGIAKAQGRFTETRAGSLKGKIPYMSPEQARGRPLDQRSDVLSAGLVLWECIVGRRCHNASGDNEVLRSAAYAEHQTFTELGLGVDVEVEQIVERAIRRDPLERFQSAGEMAQALEAYHRRAHPRFSPEELGAVVEEVTGVPRSQSGAFLIPSSGDLGQSESTFPEQPSPLSIRTGPTLGNPAPNRKAKLTPTVEDVPRDATTDWGLGGSEAAEPPPEQAASENAEVADTVSPGGWQPPSPAAQVAAERKAARRPAPSNTLPEAEFGPTKPTPAEQEGPMAPNTKPAKATKVAPSAAPPAAAPPAAPTSPAVPERAPSSTTGGISILKGLALVVLTLAIGAGVFVGISYFDRPEPGDPELVRIAPGAAPIHPGRRGDPTIAGGANLPAFPEAGVDGGIPTPPSEHRGKGSSNHGEVAAGGEGASEHRGKHSKEPQGEGQLDLTCKPDCVVYLDGAQIGHSPLTNVTVPSGNHALKLRNVDTGLEKKVKLEVGVGEHVFKNYNLVLDP